MTLVNTLISIVVLLVHYQYCFSEKAWDRAIKNVKSGKGAGIIFCVGKKRSHFSGVWASIMMIRTELHSKLPIEIWMYEFEWTSMKKKLKIAIQGLESQDVTVHFISPPHKDIMSELSGGLENTREATSVFGDYIHFSTKPKALLESELDEVLLLDTDAVLFVQPEILFDLDPYKRTGTMFLNDKPIDWWPANYPSYDPGWMQSYIRRKYPHRNMFRRFVPLSHEDVSTPLQEVAFNYTTCKNPKVGRELCSPHRQESSLVLFNKRMQYRAAAVLWDLTVNEAVKLYERIYGDKDSYWVACEIAGSPYYFSQWAPGHWGLANTSDNTCPDKVVEPHVAHFLPTGNGPTQLMSLNQLKQKNVRDVSSKLALSNPIRSRVMKSSLYNAVNNRTLCPQRIKGFRRIQRCWSRYLKCSSFGDRELTLLKNQVELQQQAKMLNFRDKIEV